METESDHDLLPTPEMGKLQPADHMQPAKCFFAARQKLLGSKNSFVYDILIDIVLFITVGNYVTSFSKYMCFSAYIPLCVLRKYLATYYAALERLRICEYGPCTAKFAHPCPTLFHVPHNLKLSHSYLQVISK